MRSPGRWVTALALAAATSGCASPGSGGAEVSDARLAQPSGPNAALYLTVSTDRPDRLVGATTGAADVVEIHETVSGDDGRMTMTPVEGFDIESGEPLVLEPGGKHLMLVDADRLQEGDTVSVTLHLEEEGDIEVEVPVVAPQESMGEMGHGDG